MVSFDSGRCVIVAGEIVITRRCKKDPPFYSGSFVIYTLIIEKRDRQTELTAQHCLYLHQQHTLRHEYPMQLNACR